MNESSEPSRTAAVLPVSTSVWWSLTMLTLLPNDLILPEIPQKLSPGHHEHAVVRAAFALVADDERLAWCALVLKSTETADISRPHLTRACHLNRNFAIAQYKVYFEA